MLNHIVIMGRLTRDPDLRYTQSQTPVASFTVAVDREGNKRRSAEVVADNVYFGESKRREDSDSGYSRSSYDAPRRDGHNYAASSPAVDSGRGASAFAELEDDDGDLPF